METSSPFQGNIPGAPPPPPEVKVRTMRSDLESMARSGGGAPRFQNVAITGLATQEGGSSVGGAAQAQNSSNSSSRSLLGPVLVAVVALIAIAIVGYFAYTILSPSAGRTQQPTGTSATP